MTLTLGSVRGAPGNRRPYRNHDVERVIAGIRRARGRLGEAHDEERAIERAFHLAEPDRLVTLFAYMPSRELLERHARQRTAPPSRGSGTSGPAQR